MNHTPLLPESHPSERVRNGLKMIYKGNVQGRMEWRDLWATGEDQATFMNPI